MSAPDDDGDDLALRAGDHVELKEDGATGRVVGPGSKHGRWKVRLDESMAVEEIAEGRLEPTC
jgi:hypothetical protein